MMHSQYYPIPQITEQNLDKLPNGWTQCTKNHIKSELFAIFLARRNAGYALALSETMVPSDAACVNGFCSPRSKKPFTHSPESTFAKCSPYAKKSHKK